MGKRDTQKQHLPVDQYRKTIGKAEYKRNKKEIKRVKQAGDARKTNTTFRDALLVLMSVLLLVCAIYMIMYFQLTK